MAAAVVVAAGFRATISGHYGKLRKSLATIVGNVMVVLCAAGVSLAAGAYMYTFGVFEEWSGGLAIAEILLLPLGLLSLLSAYFWLRSRDLGRQSARRERAEWELKRSERSLVQAQRIARIGDWEYGLGGGRTRDGRRRRFGSSAWS